MPNLAINGGPKLREKDFTPWTQYTEEDQKGLLATYESGKWGYGGEQNQKFCEEFAAYTKAKHVITCANGTVSIELIMQGLGIGRGDEVIVPPYTFIASISSLIYVGVTPVFADIDPETYNLSPEAAEAAITPRTKAIMPVYIGGRPPEMDKFEALCEKYGLYLIGDAAQAVGSEYAGRGMADFGIAHSISCQNSKNLTSGEGGIILTNNDELYENITRILNMGKGHEGTYTTIGCADGMSEWQASMLRTQLQKLPEQIARRMENAAYLDEQLAKLDFVEPLKKDEKIIRNSYHLYVLTLKEEMLQGVSRDAFLKALNAEGIPLTAGYMPLYTFPCVDGTYAEKCIGSRINVAPECPVTERKARHEGCWLIHQTLLGNRSDMDDIVNGLIKVYNNLDELKGGAQA